MVICPHCQAQNAEGARFCGVCGKATQATHPVSDPRINAEPPSLIGREIAGRFRILAKLGEGGMGTVYRAEQMSLKRTIALKLLRPEVAGSPLLLRRFNAEAEAVAKLNHPNTVGIYDFGQDTDGTLFISMEFIEGRSLRAVVHTEAPLPLRRSLAIAMQVCASLIDAHGHDIVHRDLKPDNVMLQDRGRARDVVRVLDFGIAKLRDDSRQSQMAMTQAGDMLGTPQYMAPEQIRGERVDGRVDIYSMGCMLYEMVTARLPYDAPNVMALLSKHLLEQVTPPSQRRPDLNLPPMIDELILTAMAKDPNARPPTMEAFAERVAHVMSMLPPETGAGYAPPPASSAMPMVHAPTPGVPSPAYGVPSPVGGMHVPTPGIHAPAPHTPPPGPPPPGPYAPSSNAAQGAYNPYPPAVAIGTGPVPPPSTSTQPPPEPKSRTLLWVMLAVLFIAGGGIAAYFLSADLREAEQKKTTPEPSESDPDDPWSAKDGSNHGTQVAIAPTIPAIPAIPPSTPPAPPGSGTKPAEAGDPAEALDPDDPPEPAEPPEPDVPDPSDFDTSALAAMGDGYADMMKELKNIDLRELPGWYRMEYQGMKVLSRQSPITTITTVPIESFSSYGTTFEIEVLGASRRASSFTVNSAGMDVQTVMVEMKGPSYKFVAMLTQMGKPMTNAEIGELLGKALVLPAATP